MWHLFLSTERSVLIVTNKSTCSDILGSRALHHSYGCGLDLGIFLWAVPVVTAGHCLSFSLEGAAFVSWVSFHPLCWWNVRIQPVLLAEHIRCRRPWGLLGVQKTSAEHPQISPAAQAQGIRCIWDVAELLLETRVAGTGNSALVGASGHCARVGCCVMLSGIKSVLSKQRLELISIRKSSCYSHDAEHFAAPSDHTGSWECGIWGNQAECLPEDGLGILLQTCVWETLALCTSAWVMFQALWWLLLQHSVMQPAPCPALGIASQVF